MTSLVICARRPSPGVRCLLLIDRGGSRVTVLDGQPGHPPSPDAESPESPRNILLFQRHPAVAPAHMTARRFGPGAGATPELAAEIRHHPRFARQGSLGGRSRTWSSKLHRDSHRNGEAF